VFWMLGYGTYGIHGAKTHKSQHKLLKQDALDPAAAPKCVQKLP